MRVLTTTDTVGGVWTYVCELARALPQTQFHVAAMGDGTLSQSQQNTAQTLPNVVVHTGRYRLEWMAEPWPDVARAGEWLLRLERELRPDIIHLNGFVHGALPFHAPVLVVGHSDVLSWHRAVRDADAADTWAHYAQMVRSGLQNAARVVAPTRAMLDALQLHYGPLPRAQVIHNSANPARFTSGPKQPFILCAGRLWDDAKNIQTLAEAAHGLPWPVHVAGDDRSPDGTMRHFPHVRLLGSLTPAQLAHQMSEASVYALPARYEPFGLSVLEAALSGDALVLGDIASLREVWGDAALYVPPSSADALRDTLHRLCTDNALREHMAGRALARAAHYSPVRMASSYSHAYSSLLAATHNPA